MQRLSKSLSQVADIINVVEVGNFQHAAEPTSIPNQNSTSTSTSTSTGTKPIMYTFYKRKRDKNEETTNGDQALLQLWTDKWTEAGWDARILTTDDAKRHPRFEEFDEKLSQVPLNGNNEDYNRLCYYRWLAVAAAGGGWMSDMDVLPLNFHQPENYFKDGRFAIYSATPYGGGIPCLMSGSESEWERLAFAAVENGLQHQNEYFWSDMFASVDLYFRNPKFYELFDLMGEAKEVDWNEDSCNLYKQKLAIHFSHSAVSKMGLHDVNKRPRFSNDWMNKWKVSCKDAMI